MDDRKNLPAHEILNTAKHQHTQNRISEIYRKEVALSFGGQVGPETGVNFSVVNDHAQTTKFDPTLQVNLAILLTDPLQAFHSA